MDNEKKLSDIIPSLTLNTSDGDSPIITGNSISADNAVADSVKETEKNAIDESRLSPEEKKLVDDFSKKINLTDSTLVMTYGAPAQQKVADFSDSALQNIKTKDLGETGDMILNLVGQLNEFSVDDKEKGGFFGFFKKSGNKIENLKNRYDKAEISVDKIIGELEGHQIQLLKDISMLDRLYDVNLANYKELNLYIIAGRKSLDAARDTTLKEFTARAHETGLPEDAQTANDFASLCNRFDKKLHDLELTRMIAIQSAPQIRMVQGNNTLMAEKIQSTIVNTIPLWKSQMLISLGLAHSQQALEAERAVTDMTNQLLKKNADLLKTGTVEIARESERGVVDVETLTYTNSQLISTLDEVLKIQEDGRAKRLAAESELRRMEGELKSKLLEIKN